MLDVQKAKKARQFLIFLNLTIFKKFDIFFKYIIYYILIQLIN